MAGEPAEPAVAVRPMLSRCADQARAHLDRELTLLQPVCEGLCSTTVGGCGPHQSSVRHTSDADAAMMTDALDDWQAAQTEAVFRWPASCVRVAGVPPAERCLVDCVGVALV